ncbi:MAG: hypothetical protein GXO07_01775 [Crenarchaeota archaeon]|nr:hypothetical protein [Thermoproteota archaeon]
MKKCLEKANRYKDPTEATACFLACLGKAYDFVVTGGFAVELYTGGAYRTLDVDLIPLSGFEELEEALNELGRREAREWTIRGLLKAIDVLPPGETEYIVVKTPCGDLKVEAPERLLVRYLAAWKFWESSEDRDKAVALAFALEDLISWEKVRELAKKEGVEDKLRELEEWLGRLRSRSSRGGG